MNKGKRLLLFIILFIGMYIFSYIPLELFHINLDNLSQNMKILYSFACDLGYLIIIFLIYWKRNKNELTDYCKNIKSYFKISIIYYIIGLMIMYISNIIISIYFTEAVANNEVAVKALISKYPIYMLFATVIYAPIVEETIFRRSIKDVFLAFGDNLITKYGYIIISGLLFALMHIVGMVNSNLDYLYIIPYLSLGIAFAALYYKTDNLYTTIILHALHNLMAILMYLLIGV